MKIEARSGRGIDRSEVMIAGAADPPSRVRTVAIWSGSSGVRSMPRPAGPESERSLRCYPLAVERTPRRAQRATRSADTAGPAGWKTPYPRARTAKRTGSNARPRKTVCENLIDISPALVRSAIPMAAKLDDEAARVNSSPVGKRSIDESACVW